MSQRDIVETIEDIYGFEISHETISQITDCVLDELGDWQNRPLKRIYTFLFVDCMYVTIRKEYESKNYAVYTILGYDTDGEKDILGLWLNESESKHTWMQIFDELKTRGVEDVLFISMDGVSGLEEGAKAIFKDVEQLFAYGSAVRKVMYTTNAVESINSSFRKVTKKGAFPNENALLKLLYLRITELYKKMERQQGSELGYGQKSACNQQHTTFPSAVFSFINTASIFGHLIYSFHFKIRINFT